jgi:lysophospholipase L1-like esterase
MKTMARVRDWIACVALAALVGCGGGGGGGDAEAPATGLQLSAGTVIDVYGDSTVAGWDGATRTYIAQTASKVLADLTGATVNNFGVSGAEADDRLPDWAATMAASRADIVVLAYGMNDASRCDAGRFTDNMRALVDGVPAGRRVVLQTPNYAWETGSVDAAKVVCVRQFAQVVRDIAASHGIPVIDVYALTEPLVAATPALMPDGNHPTEALYGQIGREMARVLAQL